MSHEVETMFSRTVPWHGLGTVTGEALRAEDAIRAAGLDWTVAKRPVKYNFGGSLQTDNRHFVTVRESDGQAFGIVGTEFVPLQNVEAFEVLDDLVGDGELLFDSAGSLRSGRVVFVCAKLPQAVKVAGHDDVELYAVLSHGHDGTRAISVDITPIMTVCMNTLTLGQQLAKSHVKVQHRSNAKARLRDAGEVLGLMYDYAATLSRISDELAAVEMDLAASRRFVEGLYRDDKACSTETVRAKHAEGTLTTLEKSDRIRDEHRFTAWGNFQAVTEWWDWRRPQRENDTVETRVRSTWDGAGRHFREKSLQLLGVR